MISCIAMLACTENERSLTSQSVGSVGARARLFFCVEMVEGWCKFVRDGIEMSDVDCTGLTPLTEYAFILETCTSQFCANNTNFVVQTTEGAPPAPDVPDVLALSSSQILIEWNPSSEVFGTIIEYTLLRNGSIVYQSTNTSVVEFTDATVVPATVYAYALVAATAGGNATSNASLGTTFRANPEQLQIPVCTVTGAHTVQMIWTVPLQPNGDIVSYQILQETSTVVTLDTDARMYEYTNLTAFTDYRLAYSVCITTGCAVSSFCAVRTLPAAPTDMQPPTLTALNTSAVLVAWDPPHFPNGVLTSYEVSYAVVDVPSQQAVLNVSLLSIGASFKVLASVPATSTSTVHAGISAAHTVVLYFVTVYNAQGNTTSMAAAGRSAQAEPSGVPTASVNLIQTESATVTWTAPTTPNGFIVGYALTATSARAAEAGGIVSLSVNDTTTATLQGLLPFTNYTLVLTAFTTVGGTAGEPTRFTTLEGTPQGVQPATVATINASVLQATWAVPLQPNGRITGYTVVVIDVARGTPVQDFCDGVLNRTCTITGLNPFTVYAVAVRACIGDECTLGATVTARTAEALPRNLTAPEVIAVNATALRVTWTPPTHPNGIITHVRLHRMQSAYLTIPETDAAVVVDTGSAVLNSSAGFDFVGVNDTIDAGLFPFTNYTYAVVAYNSVGSIVSETAVGTTLMAPPAPVVLFAFDTITSTSLALSWNTSARLNGIVTGYSVRVWPVGDIANATTRNVTGTSPSSFLPSQLVTVSVGGLMSHTRYRATVSVSNAFGTTESSAMEQFTCEDAPSGPHNVSTVASTTAVEITWAPPAALNGELLRYLVQVSGTIFDAVSYRCGFRPDFHCEMDFLKKDPHCVVITFVMIVRTAYIIRPFL